PLFLGLARKSLLGEYGFLLKENRMMAGHKRDRKCIVASLRPAIGALRVCEVEAAHMSPQSGEQCQCAEWITRSSNMALKHSAKILPFQCQIQPATNCECGLIRGVCLTSMLSSVKSAS